MEVHDPEIITSTLSGRVTDGSITVTVEIFRLEHESEWCLEVVNEAGTSTTWCDPFESDVEAYAAFRRTVREEGLETFLDCANPKSVAH